jgi:hypothetical protein
MTFGWIGQLNIEKVPSCQDCFRARAQGHQSRAGRQCDHYCDWRALGTDYTYTPLDHKLYPDCSDGTFLKYRKGDLKGARDSSKAIVGDYKSALIGRKEAEALLRNVGLNCNVVRRLEATNRVDGNAILGLVNERIHLADG